jgi:PhnB protein
MSGHTARNGRGILVERYATAVYDGRPAVHRAHGRGHYAAERNFGFSTGWGGIVQTRLNPYLSFRDSARDAMEFYQSVFGGQFQLNTFKEFGASQDPSEDNKVMHSLLEAENGITLMAADTPNAMEYRPGTNMSLSLSGDNETELRTYFEKLSAGGTVAQPLTKASWGDTFGMFTDKFGVPWMVNISGQGT